MVAVGYRQLINTLSHILTANRRDPLDRLVVILEFSKNKYDEEISDVRIKNMYIYDIDERLERLDIHLDSSRFYSVFKLRNRLEYGAFIYDGEELKISNDLTPQIVVKDRDGKYGKFKSMYLKTNDYAML